MTKSLITAGKLVTFPEWTGERIYMEEFKQAKGLPVGFERWQPLVDAMLANIKTDKSIFLMVDQGFVKAGEPHRRPGIHVDGFWYPNLKNHGHRFMRGVHGGHKMQLSGNHGHRIFGNLETLALASNVLGCRAFLGSYYDEPKEGGDCSHVDVSKMDVLNLEPNRVYYGDTGSLLHESIPLEQDSFRTVVRLNIKA